MANDYWNKCKILKVISNKYCKGSEEWLLVENRDSSKFEVFASCCKKFEGKKGKFDFNKFRGGKNIEIKIDGHYICTWPKDFDKEYWNDGYIEMINKSDEKKYFLLGEIIKKGSRGYGGERGRLLKSRNMYAYFIDNQNKTKEGDKVLLSIYGVIDIK